MEIFPIKNLDKIVTPESSPTPTPDPTVFGAPEATEEQHKKSKQIISPSNLHKSFMNKIENDKKMKYFNIILGDILVHQF